MTPKQQQQHDRDETKKKNRVFHCFFFVCRTNCCSYGLYGGQLSSPLPQYKQDDIMRTWNDPHEIFSMVIRWFVINLNMPCLEWAVTWLFISSEMALFRYFFPISLFAFCTDYNVLCNFCFRQQNKSETEFFFISFKKSVAAIFRFFRELKATFWS